MIEHRMIVYRSEDLQNGFIGKSCSFEHIPLKQRSDDAKQAYQRLRDDLLCNGMQDPLITYQGHVLIGMRRFEILKNIQAEFKAVEVLEDVATWTGKDIDRLQAFKKMIYGDKINKFVG